MSHSTQSNFKQILWKLLSRLKLILGADYSFADLNINSIKRQILSAISSLGHIDQSNLMQAFSDFITRSRTRLFYLLAVMSSILLLIFVLLPYQRSMMDRLSIRPAQWSHLQNLITDSHVLAIPANPQSSPEQFELQAFKVMLLSRDIKPVNLVIIAGNPVKVELKANEVLFSALLDILEQARIQWRLYPEELNIQAGNLPGVVTIDGRLVQYLDPEVSRPVDGKR